MCRCRQPASTSCRSTGRQFAVRVYMPVCIWNCEKNRKSAVKNDEARISACNSRRVLIEFWLIVRVNIVCRCPTSRTQRDDSVLSICQDWRQHTLLQPVWCSIPVVCCPDGRATHVTGLVTGATCARTVHLFVCTVEIKTQSCLRHINLSNILFLIKHELDRKVSTALQ